MAIYTMSAVALRMESDRSQRMASGPACGCTGELQRTRLTRVPAAAPMYLHRGINMMVSMV